MPTREFRKDTAQRMTAPSAGVVGTRAWPFLRDREITAHRGPQSLASAERTTASPRVGGAGRAAVPRAASGNSFLRVAIQAESEQVCGWPPGTCGVTTALPGPGAWRGSGPRHGDPGACAGRWAPCDGVSPTLTTLGSSQITSAHATAHPVAAHLQAFFGSPHAHKLRFYFI